MAGGDAVAAGGDGRGGDGGVVLNSVLCVGLAEMVALGVNSVTGGDVIGLVGICSLTVVGVALGTGVGAGFSGGWVGVIKGTGVGVAGIFLLGVIISGVVLAACGLGRGKKSGMVFSLNNGLKAFKNFLFLKVTLLDPSILILYW